MTPAFKGAVTDVSARLNDEYVVASSTDQNKITLFRTKTNRSILNYLGHEDVINACKFNWSQKSVISCSDDKTIRHWDMNTAKCKQINKSMDKIFNIDLVDSEVILASTHHKQIRFWSCKNEGKVVHTIENAHGSIVTCARFTPDENLVISTGHDHTVKVWDVRKWQEIYKPSFENDEYTCPSPINHTKLAISPNSQFVVIGSQNGVVLVLDIKKGHWKVEEIFEDIHTDPVIGVEWQPRGNLFATIDRSGGLYTWKD